MTVELDILHVDMDAFFAAVEVLDNPSLRGRQVIVGGTGSRGVVASCSYEARGKGVRSAMSMVEARHRCPNAVVLPGRHGRYGEVSRELHKVFEVFTPLIEPIALDEAFLDVSGSHRLFGTSSQIAEAIRERVAKDLELCCSVGVARCKLLAKLASRAAKPVASPHGPVSGPGIFVVPHDRELEFLHPRPVFDLWGVGPRTAERLARYGIATVGDLASIDPAHLVRLVGRAAGTQLHELAWARDDRPVVPDRPVKSVSHEETFAIDVHDPEQLRLEVVRMADSVSSRLRANRLQGRTVTVKLRYGDFTTITRSHSLQHPLASTAELVKIATALLAATDTRAGVRLLGVGVSSLEERASAGSEQLALWDMAEDAKPNAHPDSPAHSDLDAAVDAIRERYGVASLGPAALVGSSGLRIKQVGDSPWGPSQ
ncbi:MAG: DNA polymerase IV [Acidimicrobiales bacterium]